MYLPKLRSRGGQTNDSLRDGTNAKLLSRIIKMEGSRAPRDAKDLTNFPGRFSLCRPLQTFILSVCELYAGDHLLVRTATASMDMKTCRNKADRVPVTICHAT